MADLTDTSQARSSGAPLQPVVHPAPARSDWAGHLGRIGRLFEAVKRLFHRQAFEASLRERLKNVLRERGEAGKSLTAEERRMLGNILSFGELRVSDVMVPRADIVAIDETASLEDILRICRASNHSRLPIYRETLDDPVGMAHIKDLLRWLAPRAVGETAEAFSLRRLRRQVIFAPPSMSVLDLLLKMQTTRIHLALVIDEYGGTDGLVSIEDLVEEIVGDIKDEHDVIEGPLLIAHEDGTIDASARTPIKELEVLLGMELVSEEDGEDLDTLGGLVVWLVGRVPLRGELITHPAGLEFEVRDADPRRIKRVRVHQSSPVPSGSDAASAPRKD